MLNNRVEEFVSRFGTSGFPNELDEKYKPTWDAYDSRAMKIKTPKDRVLNVLGFLHLLNQASCKTPIVPGRFYEAMLQTEFENYALVFAKELRKARIFDLFRVYKTVVGVDPNLRGSGDISISLCLLPRKNEPLDNTLHKAEGFLYRGEMPIFLREKWKKMPINSKAAKPKSLLPKFMSSVNDPSVIGRLPVFIGDGCALYANRVADGMLVLRFQVSQQVPNIPWLSRHAHHQVLKRLWSSAFKSLKG